MPDPRPEPPPVADERATLLGFLDFHRATLFHKVDGLDDDQLRRVMVPSGLSPLGVLKHCGYVERAWFQADLAGRDVMIPWRVSDAGYNATTMGFVIEPDETTADVLAFLEGEITESRTITEGRNLDETFVRRGEEITLRWLLGHMIEELARHNGHLDIMRELIDGQTGE